MKPDACVPASIPLLFACGLLLTLASTPAVACGPFFPDRLLVQGDDALLVAHSLFFDEALSEIGVPPAPGPRDDEQDAGGSPAGIADVAELREALASRSPQEAAAILASYAAFRERIQALTAGDTVPVDVPAGLPKEFEYYIRGAAAWYAGKLPIAVFEWRRVLELPPAERQHRGAWAAFMLGRALQASLKASSPDAAATSAAALAAFQRVPALVREGARDTLGLAADAPGQEARTLFLAGRYAEALSAYARLADRSSLRVVCRRVAGVDWAENTDVEGDEPTPAPAATPDQLRALAAAELPRRIYTAYLASAIPAPDPASARWIDALAAAGVKSVPEAATAAWLAYRAGRFEEAAAWAALAPETDARGAWVRAKLLLRAGKLDEAAPLLASARAALAPAVPGPSPGTSDDEYYASDFLSERPAHARVAAELGTAQLLRGAYAEALDAFLAGGSWVDAAHVAERVMTIEELHACLAAREAAAQANGVAAHPVWAGREDGLHVFDVNPEAPRPEAATFLLRWLYARRLVRAGRAEEALAFFPAGVRAQAERYLRGLAAGRDAAAAREARADALWDAARTMHRAGMELRGTEVEPDWFAYGGEFDDDGAAERRTSGMTAARPDELARVERHTPTPDTRFHYRYVAADLAWEAAGLMPDQTEKLARTLVTAGRWLAARDPKAADRFYRALVRRCGRTDLGRDAAKRRWFPELPAS